MAEKEVGKVSTYFGHIGVAAIKLSDKLKVSDRIRVKGHTTDFEQLVDSIQVDKKEVKEAGKGEEIGIKVIGRVRPNDTVFLVE